MRNKNCAFRHDWQMQNKRNHYFKDIEGNSWLQSITNTKCQTADIRKIDSVESRSSSWSLKLQIIHSIVVEKKKLWIGLARTHLNSTKSVPKWRHFCSKVTMGTSSLSGFFIMFTFKLKYKSVLHLEGCTQPTKKKKRKSQDLLSLGFETIQSLLVRDIAAKI